jgi:hypothetical protein
MLPSYEPLMAGVGAVAMVALVLLGFIFRPRRDTFYLRTTVIVIEPDHRAVEHDRIAIRVELVRLWLLFLPTFAAVAFLVVTSVQGTVWHFSLLDRFWDLRWYAVIQVCRAFVVIVVGLLSTWVSERWVLRDAEACSADSVSTKTGGLLYSFKDLQGGYYGGEGFLFGLVKPAALARVVFYRPSNPQQNKISMACLFHRPVIIGRGLTDLDEATASAHSVKVQPASPSL